MTVQSAAREAVEMVKAEPRGYGVTIGHAAHAFDLTRLCVLVETVGSVGTVFATARQLNPPAITGSRHNQPDPNTDALRYELVHVAAIALDWITALDALGR